MTKCLRVNCLIALDHLAFGLKGIKTANWDIPSHQFTILYDANKVSLEEVHQAIANAGHDTPLATASDEVYENLPMCCLYDRKKKVE